MTVARVLLAWLASLAAALVLTPRVRDWAIQRGWVPEPRSDRWSTRPVALSGGIAIALAALLGALVTGAVERRSAALLVASLVLFAVGLWDDRRSLGAGHKLLVQVITALALVAAGFRLGGSLAAQPWAAAMTVLWLVGIANAFNLLDNMDGLCAGVAAIAAGFVAVLQLSGGDPGAAALTAALGGACLGYLRYNRHPATVFMGDCGSLFIGFYLGAASLLSANVGAGRSTFAVVLLPFLLMLLPLIDTTLVTVARRRAGRPVSQGGSDHCSHRLVALGLAEPQAVKVLYGLCLAGGGAALAVRWLDWYLSLLLLPGLLFGVGTLGWYLLRVQVYDPAQGSVTPLPEQPPGRLLRIGAMLLDAFAVGFGFFLAEALRYEGAVATPAHLTAFHRAVGPVVLVHLACYLGTGVYRGLWRYTSAADLRRFLVATGLAWLGSWAALAALRRLDGSHTLLALNWLVQLAFLAGTRVTLKLIHEQLQAARKPNGRRVLAVGVGIHAEPALRLLKADPELGPGLVGTICEREAAVGLHVLGVPVVATSRTIDQVLSTVAVTDLVLLDDRYPEGAWRRIQSACRERGVAIRMVKNVVEPDDPQPLSACG